MGQSEDVIERLRRAEPVCRSSTLRSVARRRHAPVGDQSGHVSGTLRRHGRAPLLAMVAAPLALSVAGGAVAAAYMISRQDGAAVQFAPSTGSVAVVTGDPADEVRATAKAFPHVRNAVVRPTADGGSELTYELEVRSFAGRDTVEPMWEGTLFAAAVREKYLASQLPPIEDVAASLVTRGGGREPVGGGFGNVVRGQRFLRVSETTIREIKHRAKGLGVTSVVVTRLTAIQEAVRIVVVVADPIAAIAKMRANGGVLRALLGPRASQYEGVLVRIEDAANRPVYVESFAGRAGAGSAWADRARGLTVGRGFAERRS